MALKQIITRGAVAIATKARDLAARAKAEITSKNFNPTRGVIGGTLRSIVSPALFGSTGTAARSIGAGAELSAPAVRGAVGRGIAGAVGLVKNAFKPATLSALPKQLAANVVGASLPFLAYDIASSRSLGEGFKKFGGQVQEIAALGINPLGGLIGVGSRKGADVIDWAKNIKEDFAQPEIPNYNFPSFQPAPINLTTGGPETTLLFPESIGGSLGGGFSPSISVGGGPDVTPLLLALLGGGAAGFIVGRRKKKSKKSKRKKYKGKQHRR